MSLCSSSSSSPWLRRKPRNAFLGLLHIILVTLSFYVGTSEAITTPIRLPASLGYQGRSNACPARCAVSGPNSGNWSLYHNFEQFSSCQESLFYSFSFLDPVDDPDTLHHIYTCTSFGPDWANLPVNTSGLSSQSTAVNSTNGTYQIGSWPSAPGSAVSYSLAALINQFRQYLSGGFAPVNRPTILFASYGSTSVGLYIGSGLQNQGIGDTALAYLEQSVSTSNASLSAQVAMQFCQPGLDSDHIFGLMATGNGTFAGVQEALISWSKAKCLTYPLVVQNVTALVPLLTPLYINTNTTNVTNITGLNGTSASTSTNSTSISARARTLAPRTTCSTITVASGDGCASLAQKCGITGAQFTQYNPASNECSTLQPGEHVCCSAGTLPNFAPTPQPDGTCATYTIQPNDDCSSIAATWSITVAEINSYNTDTWGWSSCTLIYADAIICLSTGNPPMPAVVANAVCGPQVPGTATPPAGTDLSQLNTCPLNACCDIWGQCGTTTDFCTKSESSTGAPGTAAPGTNGCISNCGTNIVLSSPPATYRNIGFFEGYNLQRPCLYQDISQLDVSSYTHVYFSFGVLSTAYVVQIPDVLSTYEFNLFKEIQGAKRILSIGGWAFSTDPSTYMIFREGVTSTNRLTMATNIANFINDNDLDGVNIDWEYPGAPDIPGIPAASTDDGANYLDFLAILRNLLLNKEVTIAAPASYWYLKGFPIEKMAPLVDYIIYMTYDLHGQWDSGNQWSQLSCTTGTCLRTDVNLTETIGTLVMITKAGVPSNKVVVGVTSYGRSFAMAEAGCYGPQCTFLGSASDSQATPGICTGTAGYIANAEILGILANSSRVNQNFVDSDSNTNILVYDETQWVGWMSDSVKAQRKALYQGLSMGGTSDWATDLQAYNPPPYTANNWGLVINDVVSGGDPYAEGPRTGNWTSLNCDDPAIQDALHMPCAERWAELDAANAWSDTMNIWFTNDSTQLTGYNAFTLSMFNTWHITESANCRETAPDGYCNTPLDCAALQGFGLNTGGSGPAVEVLYESIALINSMYSELYSAINAASGYIDSQLDYFELTFAPVAQPKSDEWLVILIALLGLGLTAVAAPFFAGVIGDLPALLALGDAGIEVTKDITYALIAFGATIATAEIPPPGSPGTWTAQSQASFSATLGTVVAGWASAAENQLWNLFNGSEPSVALIGTLIANGQLIEGNDASPSVPSSPTGGTQSSIEGFIDLAFFGFAIPQVWLVSGTAAFVLDSGYPCSAQNPLSQYMTAATQEATYTCYNNNLYYLVYPDGTWSNCANEDSSGNCEGTFFTAPPGLNTLGPTSWGGITLADLIEGSVNTYVANGNSNGGAFANPLDQQTLQDLQDQDITTPGYIRLPVCSALVAWTSWSNPSQSNSSASGYPCNPLQGTTKCSGYTYIDETSSASPKVSDCNQIIKNIQGTSGTWTTGIGGQRSLASFGTCHFGVQNNGVTGDVTFFTGTQDIVNIITQAISQFAFNGLVGAKGYMNCGGDVNSQKAEWGLY